MVRLTRRQLLSSVTAAATLGVVRPGFVQAQNADADRVTLNAVTRTIEVQGKAAKVLGIEQPDGTRGLFTSSNRRFRVRLENHLTEETLIHWHGLTPPSEQDGVPGLSQPALKPGATYHYDFALKHPGTHWMHSHVGLQEQRLLAAPLIVRDPAEAGIDEQEVVILLHDFTFKDPEEIFAGLRGGGMAMSMDDGSSKDGDHAMESGGGQMQGRAHYNDVDFDAYLANDRTLADPEVVRVDPASQVRLRIINAAAATNFHVDLGRVPGALIAVDGQPVAPVTAGRFPLAIAQRIDLRLALPAGQGAYPILALREDDTAQTGVVLATKAATLRRLPDLAKMKAPPLDLALERRLSASAQAPRRPADRELLLELTGSHGGYDWGLNGKVFDPADPLTVRQDEQVEIDFVNKTTMPHPMHLHGHSFQVVGIDGASFAGALRDTVLVPPESQVKIAFLADNPGHWAFHCHQIYHMHAGMMTSVLYKA